MHTGTRRLANDENSRRRTSLHNRARAEPQMRVAGATRAHVSQQAFERLIALKGRSFDDLDPVRFHNWQLVLTLRSSHGDCKDLERVYGIVCHASNQMHIENE